MRMKTLERIAIFSFTFKEKEASDSTISLPSPAGCLEAKFGLGLNQNLLKIRWISPKERFLV